MPADRVDPDDEVSGAVGSSSFINSLPRGKIGRDRLLTNSAGTTSTESILSDTVTVPDGREIDVTAVVTVRSDIPGGCQAALLENGTQIQRKNQDLIDTTKDLSWMFFAQRQPGAGSYTYEVITGVSGAAGNTVTAIANGEAGTHGTCDLKIVDEGPAL